MYTALLGLLPYGVVVVVCGLLILLFVFVYKRKTIDTTTVPYQATQVDEEINQIKASIVQLHEMVQRKTTVDVPRLGVVLASIGTTLQPVKVYFQGQTGMFRVASVFIMCISMIHGSHLFAGFGVGTDGNIQIINLLVTATIDVTIYMMMELLFNSIRRGSIVGSIMIIVLIIFFSTISYIGNLSYNEQYYQVDQFSRNDDVIRPWLPQIASCPPVCLIALSFVAAFVVKRKRDNEDDETYEQRMYRVYSKRVEKKRAKLRAKSDEMALYDLQYQKKQKYTTPLAWSFLFIKRYQAVKAVDVSAIDIDTTLKQITSTITVLTETTAKQDTMIQTLLTRVQAIPPIIESASPYIMHMHNEEKQIPSSEKDTSPLKAIDVEKIKQYQRVFNLCVEQQKFSISIEDVVLDGIAKSRIEKAISSGDIKILTHQPDSIKTSSLIRWLQNQ